MKCTNSCKCNPYSLEGKRILVTGASSGIGEAVAKAVSRMGGQVALVSRSKEKLEKVAAEMEGTSNRVVPLNLLSGEKNIERILHDLVNTWGPLNGMVHSAGIHMTVPLRNFTADEITKSVFEMNYWVFLTLSRFFVKNKHCMNGASMVAISSITALKGKAGLSVYAGSKGALISSIRCLALEYAHKNIRFNCICPGWVDTPMLDATKEMLGNELFQTNIEKLHPLGVGTPEDVANAAVYLLSDASRWVTGSSLIVDGGFSL